MAILSHLVEFPGIQLLVKRVSYLYPNNYSHLIQLFVFVYAECW